MPKKILQQVELLCKKLLWNGEVQNRGKALVAWDTLCQPKAANGLNIVNIKVWNKAVILKLLWNLAKKKEKL